MRLIIIFLLVSTSIYSQESMEYVRAKISLENHSASEVAVLGLETDHGDIALGKHIISDYSKKELRILDENNIPYEILIEDVKEWYRSQRAEYDDLPFKEDNCNEGAPIIDYVSPSNYSQGSMGGYLTYQELLTHLDQMRALYPHLISEKKAIGEIVTYDDNVIYTLKVSDNPDLDEDEPQVLYTALHHAREPQSMMQMVYYLWYLLENYESDDEIKYLVDNTEMHFVPCVNPDGYLYNEATDPNGGGLWRKNMYRENGQLFGVDLNRNYGFQWGFDDIGSSTDPENSTYRGTGPFSEPETQAIKELCESNNFLISYNYHSFGNLFIHPWGYNDQPTEEDDIFKGMGKEMTSQNNYFIGTGTETVGYTVNGDSDDWMYGEMETKNPIYTYTPEVGPNNFGFWPPASAIEDLNKNCMYLNLSVARLALNHYKVYELESEQFVQSTGTLNLEVQKLGLAEGSASISLESMSPELSFNETSFNVNLEQLKKESLSISYSIDELTENDTELFFEVSIDNGTHIYTNTFSKTYSIHDINVSQVLVFEEMANTDENWETESFAYGNQDGSWGITTQDFFSEPSSICDSPNGDYPNQIILNISTKEPIELSENANAVLSYRAKWDVETGYDFVQIMASTDNGVSYSGLCGNYTRIGSAGEPIYDGLQEDWVLEEVDLSVFNGKSILLQFSLFTDFAVNLDGFYFDDLQITASETIASGVDDILDNLEVEVLPNPFDESLYVRSSDQKTQLVRLFNVQGQVVLEKKMEVAATIDTSLLPIGFYFLEVSNASKTLVKKIVKE